MSESRQLAAVMFTDLVDSTRLAQTDERSALALIQEQERISRAVLPKFHGRVIKSTGDGLLAEFPSALDAVEGALALQKRIRSRRGAAKGPELRLRIGIHLGDVHRRGDDIIGDAVNIAARVQSVAEPGGICVSESVFKQVRNKGPFSLTALGPQSLKGVVEPIELYRVSPPREPGGERASSPDHPRLAVLPLANISPDPKDEYFADGLTEELISELSQVRGLSVIARTSVAPYKSAPKSIAQVAADLGVSTVLEGSVRKSGNQVRISLTLVDAGTQRQLWMHRYDRQVDDVFAVQDDIARHTAEALRLEFDQSGASSERKVSVPNPRFGVVTAGAAQDHYLRGLVAASHFDEDRHEEAVREFEIATRLDPTLADAYSAWASLYIRIAGDFLPMREVVPRARALAQQAIKLAPDSSEAHAALANIALQADHDWELAEQEFSTAIALNSSNVSAFRFLGMLLVTLGRFDEAKQVLRRVIVLDPGGHDQMSLAQAEILSGNIDVGVQMAAETPDHAHGPSSAHRIHLGFVYLDAGLPAEALRMADSPMEGLNDSDEFDLALLNALVGRPEAARRLADEVEHGRSKSYTSEAHLAMLYSALGERERALDLLEKDFEQGDAILWLYFRRVFFDPIRDHPRFAALLRKYRLPSGPPRAAAMTA